MIFDRLGEKGTPWHFWEDKSRLTGVPKKSVKKHEICYDPISADPIRPLPRHARSLRPPARSPAPAIAVLGLLVPAPPPSYIIQYNVVYYILYYTIIYDVRL